MCIRDSFRTGSGRPVPIEAGSSAVSASGESTGTLSGLDVATGYTAVARLISGGQQVDIDSQNFTTLSPPPSITFDFGGTGGTNFRMSYTGVTSISVSIDLDSNTDVDHSRSGLVPTQTYNHTATRRTFPIPSLVWQRLKGIRVTAVGPGGRISMNYDSRFVQPNLPEKIRSYYRAGGWNVGSGTTINMSGTFGPGTYT